MFYSVYHSPLGPIIIASNGTLLTGLWFQGQRFQPANLPDFIRKNNDDEVLSITRRWLDLYFAGVAPDFLPPIEIKGSPFRKMVADIMLQIPFGKTATYGEIAEEVARNTGKEKMSAQAVGGAVGHNSIALIIPCHRVLGANRQLTGYAAGLDRKQWLLQHEAKHAR